MVCEPQDCINRDVLGMSKGGEEGSSLQKEYKGLAQESEKECSIAVCTED